MNTKVFSFTLLVSAILLFSSCSWFKGGKSGAEDGGAAVVSINGKAVVSAKELDDAVNAIKQQQPMLEQVWPMMPKDNLLAIYGEIAKNLGDASIMLEEVRAKGWDKSAEYKKEMQRTQVLIERDMAVREFQKHIFDSIVVDDKDAEDFYTKNVMTDQSFKRAPFMTSPEGIETFAVRVESEAAARDLVAKARQSSLQQGAAAAKKEVMPFGVLSGQSMTTDVAILQEVFSMKSLPSIDFVQGMDKKSFYVVQGVRKQGAQFAPYASVKEDVKKVVASSRFPAKYQEELKKLHDQYKVTVNNEFLNSLVKNAPAAAAAGEAGEAEELAPEVAPAA